MAKVLAFGFDAKRFIFFDQFTIVIHVVVKRNTVKAEVRPEGPFGGGAIDVAALDVIERRGAESPRRLRRITSAANDVNIGGVVRTSRRRYGGIVENPLLNGQDLTGRSRHQHDIDESLRDDLFDDLAIL